jgi:hypothetical protein
MNAYMETPAGAAPGKEGGPAPSGAHCNQGRHYIPPQKARALFSNALDTDKINRTVYLTNAFSLGMLSKAPASLTVEELDLESVRKIVRTFSERGELVSAVGHESTAEVLSTLLGVRVKFNREAIKLDKGDVVIVFQLLDRLPEGKILTSDEIQALKYKFYVVVVE